MTTKAIHLGFEVVSGEPIEIPLRNTAVTGQTQESGKTTTLEGLVSRAGVSAIAFVTKRGEHAFETGNRLQPYFRDRADWQFVTSIIDATLAEKNKFLRPWIMKICRTTQTLEDVHREVKKALMTAKGLNEGVYTQLDAYLDLIVPEIRRAQLASSLTLTKGLNVMDVSSYSTPMQMLFVQSALDWVNEHAHNVVTIIPEAWEFIPEGKSSPVKASAIALVRKGSGIGNYIWVDSQDMAGVDKTILRGCPVWLIGVQREANEIKRNLNNIPANIRRPKPAEIANLERGQFYACFKDRTVKVYVQPAWMTRSQAEAIATGKPIGRVEGPPIPANLFTSRDIHEHQSRGGVIDALAASQGARSAPVEFQIQQEDEVNAQEAARLSEENARLTRENEDLRARMTDLEKKLANINQPTYTPAPRTAKPAAPPDTPLETANAGTARPVEVIEATYQHLKMRLLEDLVNETKDPVLLRVLEARAELQVEVRRKTVTADGDSLSGRCALLISEGFFDGAKGASAAAAEMARRNWVHDYRNVDKALRSLAEQGFLRIEPRLGFTLAPGAKVRIIETNAT